YDVICNKPQDVADLRVLSRKMLEPRLAQGLSNRIFFLSALSALLGHENRRPEELAPSGVPHFEQGLEQFLARERGRIKVLTPLRMAQAAIHDCLARQLPQKEALLTQPVAQLRALYEEQRPNLEELRRQRDHLLHLVERRRDALIREVES